MKRRLMLWLPYLFAGFVVATIYFGNQTRSVTVNDKVDVQTVARDDAPNISERHPSSAHVDPVCNMEVGKNRATEYGGRSWYFCADQCRDLFNANPQQYLGEACIVCRSDGQVTQVEGSRYQTDWQDKTYRFCGAEHRDAFLVAPLDYFMHSMWGLPSWLYYLSVVVILVVSFGLFEWRSFRRETDQPAPAAALNTTVEEPLRYDLLRHKSLRRIFSSARFRFALRTLLVLTFLFILGAGLFGNQLPSKNIAPLVTWTIWWGGLIWLVAYFGKMWCYVCPWDAIAEWSERLKLWGKRTAGLGLGLKWPRSLRNIWPATFLFIGLTWVELGFGVTLNPRVTAWLGLILLGLAFVSAFIFERKSFCRYGCLVGRISGLYALFSPVEVRAKSSETCRSCTTHSCFKGNEHGEGCPTFEFPATMRENTYCIMCMECLRTCESENTTVQLRPWGEDLLTLRKPRSDEAYLALIMVSLTGLHGLTMTAAWRDFTGAIGSAVGVGETIAFTLGMAAVMLAPVLGYALLVGLSHRVSGVRTTSYREYFLRYAYALLPIALFYHLAHNSEHLLMESQKVLALASDPFGQQWDLLGTATWSLQPMVNLPTLWVLQVVFVAVGHVFALWTARRTAGALFPNSRAAFRSQVPMLAAMILFSVLSLWLLKQPMEMRTSAM